MLYKKFIRLKVNPLGNNKFLQVIVVLEMEPDNDRKSFLKNSRTKKKLFQIHKFKKEKWLKFLNFLKKNSTLHKKFKPYRIYSYETSKFASQGNSFRKNFRNDLISKKIFYVMYGCISKKYLKNRITPTYYSSKSRNFMKIPIEFFETRLDSAIFRARFSRSIKNAQQLIAHQHVKVNNKIKRNKSYVLKQGDLIQINAESLEIIKTNLDKQFRERPDGTLYPVVPNYLTINYKTLEIVFGAIINFDFSTAFTFRLDTDSLFKRYYRR
jgi:small subunit ribosomal protein S4